MGIKGFFKVKAPTEQQAESGMRERMLDKGMIVKQESKNKPSTFAAYADYATDKTKAKREYAPKGYSKSEKNEAEKEQGAYRNAQSQGSYDSHGSSAGNNPYASLGSNPYGSTNGSQGSSYNSHNGNPYGQQSHQPQQVHHDPYGGNHYGGNPQHESSSSISPYNSQKSSSTAQNTYTSSRISNTQGQNRAANPYATQRSRQGPSAPPQDEFSFEPALEKTQTNQTSRTQRTYIPAQQQQQLLQEEEDLNDDRYAEEDLNDTGYRLDYANEAALQQEEQYQETEEERLQREEDEDVERIKGDIRFTKQESVASTRNTLRMAREAEESGKNTMGVLGAQAETLYNTERNLQLAEAQDRLAKEKVAELHHYNRNILKPGMKNPFTKKSRLRAQEDKLKQERTQYKVEQQRQRSDLHSSTQRVKSALNDTDKMSEVEQKYRARKAKEESRPYTFEPDSEDDEVEQEINDNMEEIKTIAGRLKGLAVLQGQEIDRQNISLRNIEEQTDKLDLNLVVNAASLRRAK